MNQLEIYTKILSYRRLSKAIQQISWNLNKIEQRYKLDFDNASEEELQKLAKFYEQVFSSLDNLNNELKNKNENKDNTN